MGDEKLAKGAEMRKTENALVGRIPLREIAKEWGGEWRITAREGDGDW